MSDNIQYRAIQSVRYQLVKALTQEIESVFPKVWKHNIVRKENLSISPDSSASRKADALVSAVITEVGRDSTILSKFIAILKEYPSLNDIANLLEIKVQSSGASMSKESSQASKSLSGGASNLPGSPRSRQPLNDTPKLDLAESLTKESGLGGEMTNPSPIAPEPEAAATPGPIDGTAVHIIPTVISDQTRQILQKAKDDSSLSQSVSETASNSNSSESGNNDQNLPVVLLKDNTTVPVSEASGVTQQELVLPLSQPSTEDPLPRTTSSDSISRSLEKIRLENERRNESMNQLEKQLNESKLNESQLKEKVDKLTEEVNKLQKENEQLETALHQTKAETQKSRKERMLYISTLEAQLTKTEADVESFKKRLATAEQQNKAEIKKLKEEIKSLEEERVNLQNTVVELQGTQKITDLENREKIVELREQLSAKKDEELERKAELCELKEKYALAQIEIAKQKAEMEEKDRKLAEERENNQKCKVQQLEEQKKLSQDQLEKAEEINQLLRTKLEMRNEEATTEPTSSQIPPQSPPDGQSPPTTSQPNDTKRENFQTESTGTPSRTTSREDGDTTQTTPHSTERENSNTESTGAPSRSGTGNNLGTGTQTDPPSEKVNFKLGGNDDSTLDLPSNIED